MYKEVLRTIKDIDIYPVITVVVFFTFFTIMSLWVLRSKKEDFESQSKMPLDEVNQKN
ncbi:MAG: CcoQ/FixQ family Cbb3-type cytochrome c oxidase assembly chaperone [Bacteroidetes bacterium]|nr:CcoQ/FixQ family Cbb3-type cytochrome c oxidase assembly chaperone [Bacteroidota bacterium]